MVTSAACNLVCLPQLHYLRLPKDISEDYVVLMDSTVSTGAAALMAVRVLLVGPQICIQVMRRWVDILPSVFS